MISGGIYSISAALRKAWRYAQGVRTSVLVSFILGTIRVGVGLVFVWVSKLLVDTATMSLSVNSTRIIHLSILLAALMLVEMAISLCVQYMQNKAEIDMKNSLRAKIYGHVLNVRDKELSRLHSADYVNRLCEDTRVLADAVTHKLPNILVFVVQSIGAFLLLYAMSAQLALCVLAIIPIFLVLSKLYVVRTRGLTAEVRDADSRIQTSVQEGIQHHVVAQTLECQPRLVSLLKGLQHSLYDWTMRRTRVGVYSRAMLNMGFISCFLTAFIWSVWHLHTGTITYGTMTAFLQLVARIQGPMTNISQLVPSLVQALASVDRLALLEDLPTDTAGACQKMEAPVGVRIEHVSFRYDDESKLIFDDFSYDFTPGSHTVIMGETGVGKTTLVRLLLALRQPQEGTIVMYSDNKEENVSSATRCNIVYVPQGNSLFEGTVRDNLLLASDQASDEEIREALHTAVASFVYDLPQGLDTPCGELGAKLSEGQAQRIAIARALLKKGSLMIFDEFNSALDAETASTLIRRLTQTRSRSTMIFISHRGDVADYCDAKLRL